MPIKKAIHVLDNELHLRSMTNNITSHCNHSSSSIGRFDELTHFFNIINGLFHQSVFTLGLSTYHLAPLFHLPELNIGINLNVDQQHQIDLWKNMTFYSVLGRNYVNTVMNQDYRQNKFMGIIKFHTFDKNLLLGINHRWSRSLTTTFRFRTVSEKTIWSHIEYRRPNETYELIGEYGLQHSSSIQFSCLSCLWQKDNYQIDGGIDLRISSRKKLADIGFRLKLPSDSIIFKCDLYHPLEHYLIGFQRYISNNFIVGLLAEKLTSYQPIKFSLMSQWHLNKTNLRINTLVNTQNQLGLALVYQIHHFPLVLQTFGLYSWTRRQCKWGVGLQILL